VTVSTRLSFLLDGRDGLSRVLDRAGDNAERLQRRFSAVTTTTTTAFNRLTGAADRNAARINASMRNNTTAVRGFTMDANGRLRDLNGRFVATGAAARRLQGDINNLHGPMRGAAAATGEASAAGGALGPVLGGVAAVVGLSLLPALGSLVPMMAGAALAAGTLKLGFVGVGDAVEAAGTDQEKYQEALKKMSPESRAFTKELVSLKKGFSGIGKDIQKAMLPGFTQALKDAKPVVDIVGKGMIQLGKGFGEAAAGAGRLFKSGGFQRDLKTNLDLGMSFVRELSGGFGALLRGLLDFGAKSKPTLDAFAGGLSGLLGKGGGGLVGMFKGLETGIGGSASMLTGLFSMLNQLLPAIGRFAGEAARTFGPLLGQLFESTGQQASTALDLLGAAVRALAPVFKDLAFGVKSTIQVFSIIGPTLRDVGSTIVGALLPAGEEVEKMRGPFQRLSEGIENNKGLIQEGARMIGAAILDMVSVAVEYLPSLIGMFRVMSTGIVTALGGILHGAASAFGWIPGIGDKLRTADETFSDFQSTFISGLTAAEQKTRDFATGALPKLEQGKLKMNITNWQSQIETAKAKLKTLPPEKQAAVKAQISDLQAKVAQAKRDLASLQNRSVTVTTRYVVVGDGSAARKSGSYGAQLKAEGGLIHGPGTGTSDDVPIWASNGEFMVKAKAVAKYGVSFLKAVNEGRLNMGAAVSGGGSAMAASASAAGGGLAGAGAEAGRGLQAGLRAAAAGVDGAARSMASAVVAGIRAELQIASPSKKTKALAADVGKGFIEGLTGSKAKIAAVSKDLVKDIVAAWKGERTTKDSRLVAMVTRDTRRLQALATTRDKLASKIATARKYALDIAGNARQGAELQNLGIADEDVTAGSIQAGLSEKLARIKQFTAYIAQLSKRGLSKELLRQVLAMGPDSGYAYASALMGMGTSALRQINITSAQVSSAATSLGVWGADSMYDAGSQAGKGFLTGLMAQEKAIEAQMLKIAKSMQKAIKKALGIKSPSTVMAALGRYTTEGLAVGMRERLPVLDQALGAVTDRVASARPVIGRPAIAGGGGMVVHNHYQVDVHGAMDPVAVGRELQKVLVKYGRAQGATVKLSVGR
jgi:hypothetical protein